MKTIEEIIENYKEYETFIDDRFGVRFCDFLTKDQLDKIGYEIVDESDGSREVKEWTRENILEQLEKDVAFGFEKALDRRGISASLMFDVVRKWNKILEEGLEDYSEHDYAMYGLPLFKATAVKYGWDNPIGDDTGTESYYNEEPEYFYDD